MAPRPRIVNSAVPNRSSRINSPSVAFAEKVATQSVGDDPTALVALASAMMTLGGDVRQAAMFTDRALQLDPIAVFTHDYASRSPLQSWPPLD